MVKTEAELEPRCVTEWYNSSMIGTDVEGFLNHRIVDQLDAKGAGLGDYTVEIQLLQALEALTCAHVQIQEKTVSYTIQLIVLDYTIVPFVDLENI